MSSSALNSTNFAAQISSGETVTQNNNSAIFPIVDNTAVNNITSGTGAGKAQHVWQNQLTCDSSSGQTLDLTALAGGLEGANRSFTKVKSIKITNTDTGIVLTVGNAASNQWLGLCSSGTATLPVNPGGFLWNHAPDANGLALIDSTHKNLLLKAASGSVVVNITIIGEGT